MKKAEFMEGKKLPVVEEFYSLQGEGYHTGKPAYFLRIGGCDLGCKWCDSAISWDASVFPMIDTDQIIQNVLDCPAASIVVTGGEPLMWNLDYLCAGLKGSGVITYLETSGAYPLSGLWDWICLSPKKQLPPLKDIYSKANELKIIISDESDFIWAEQNSEKIAPSCHLLLQPEWSVHKQMTPLIVTYIKENPKWRISLQAHKFMRIP